MAKKKAKKPRKIKKYNLKTKLVNAIRRLWYYSPQRREVVKRCKVDAHTFRCEKCRRLCDAIQVDHIEPVVKLTGWDGDWNGFIERMFVDASTGLRGLDKDCHDKITQAQAIIRKKYKNESK